MNKIEHLEYLKFIGVEKPNDFKEIKVVEITPILASELNNMWHSRLPKIHWSNITRNRYSINFALLYKKNYIGCAIWSSPVNQHFDIEKTLELRRMAISDFCPKNTATWMLSKMIEIIKTKIPLVADLISYQDTEVHLGTIYKAANWFIDGETKFATWQNKRKRNNDQSQANKIRWKYIIKRKIKIHEKENNNHRRP